MTARSAVRHAPLTKHRYANFNGGKVFYREGGDSALPTILLLHGLPTASGMFRDLIPALAREPGTTKSTCSRTTRPAWRATTRGRPLLRFARIDRRR